MSVGIQTNETTVNTQLGQVAIALRDACRSAANFQEWAVAQGLTGLEALGFSTPDAQTVLTMASYLNTVAALYFGTAAQPTDFDFDNAVCQLWGGN